MKKAIVFFASTLFVLTTSFTVSAQTNVLGFPLTINGVECSSKAACKLLCDDPVNFAACNELKPSANTSAFFQDPTFVQEATESLGCSSESGCRAICSLPINFEKCALFAQKHQIPGGYDEKTVAVLQFLDEGISDTLTNIFNEEEREQLQALKEQMEEEGETLQEFCDNENNQVACSNIAQKFGLKGGKRLEGPGGCQTTESCKSYCEDPAHFSECKRYEIAGLNGCTSELSCYAEAQANPSLLANRKPSSQSNQNVEQTVVNTEEILTACQASVDIYQGKSTSDLAGDFARSGVCQILPQSGIPGQNNNCDAYLNADQPFNKEVFSKICSITTINPGNELPIVTNFSDVSNLDSYSGWCSQLPSVGQAQNDWEVVPQICNNFVSTYKEARQYCNLPSEERPDWLKDEVTVSSYCLSAPTNFSDYSTTCAGDVTSCQNEGYDWYCKQAGKSCVPLYQGTPIDQAVSSFSDAGLIKDGDTVTVVLSDTIKDFAQDVLTQTVSQTGNTQKTIKVVSEVPQTLSSSAVFAAGIGNRPGKSGVTQPFLLKQQLSAGSDSRQRVEAFQQPWYAVDARLPVGEDNRQPKESVAPQTSVPPKEPGNMGTGWQLIKSNQTFTNLQPSKLERGSNQQRIESGVPVRPIDPALLKQVIENQGSSAPRPSISGGPTLRPEKFLQPLRSPTPAPQSGTQSIFKSPTPAFTNTGTGSTGTTLTSPKPEPTAYIPPPEPSIYQSPNTNVPSPTQPATTQQTQTTTSGETTTTTSTTGTSLPMPSPGVQGAHTEIAFWSILKEKLFNYLFH